MTVVTKKTAGRNLPLNQILAGDCIDVMNGPCPRRAST